MATTARSRGPAIGGALALPEAAWAGLLVGAFALYYASPWLPLSLLLLALCTALCYLRLELAVALVPLATPFYMLPKQLGHPTPEFSLGETAIVICAVAYAARRALALPPPGASLVALFRHVVPASALERGVALFLAAATLATVLAHFRHVALREYREVIVEPVVYYVLVVALLRDARAMARALWAAGAAGALVAVLGIGQYLFRPETLTGAYYTGAVGHALKQITSIYSYSNTLGMFLDRALPVAVTLGLLGWTAWWARRDNARMLAALLPWLAALAIGIALLLSGSRGGEITAAIACVAALLLWIGRRNPRLELAAAAVVAVVAAAVLWKVRHSATPTRLYLWTSALKMIRDRPLFGVGPDNFLYYYFNPHARDPHNPASSACIPTSFYAQLPAKHYMDMSVAHGAVFEPCLANPHNVLLDAWLSTGALGLIALLVLLGSFVVLSLRNLRRFEGGALPPFVAQRGDLSARVARAGAPGAGRARYGLPGAGLPGAGLPGAGLGRAVTVASIAIVLATVAHGMVDSSIFAPDLATMFWLGLALMAAASALPSEGAAAGAASSGPIAVRSE